MSASSSPIRLRQAQRDDGPELSALINDVAPIAYALAGSADDLARWLGANASEPRVRKRIDDPDCLVLVAQRGERMVGTGYIEHRLVGGQPTGYIGGLYCRERGVGLGSQLLDALIEEASGRNYHHVDLTVGKDNEIMSHIVRKRGFVPIAAEVDRMGFFPTVFVEMRRTADS